MNADQFWMTWPWGHGFFPLFMIIILLVFFFLLFRRRRCWPPWWDSHGHHREGRDSTTALDILKRRYAQGEINKEEFERMKKDILA